MVHPVGKVRAAPLAPASEKGRHADGAVETSPASPYAIGLRQLLEGTAGKGRSRMDTLQDAQGIQRKALVAVAKSVAMQLEVLTQLNSPFASDRARQLVKPLFDAASSLDAAALPAVRKLVFNSEMIDGCRDLLVQYEQHFFRAFLEETRDWIDKLGPILQSMYAPSSPGKKMYVGVPSAYRKRFYENARGFDRFVRELDRLVRGFAALPGRADAEVLAHWHHLLDDAFILIADAESLMLSLSAEFHFALKAKKDAETDPLCWIRYLQADSFFRRTGAMQQLPDLVGDAFKVNCARAWTQDVRMGIRPIPAMPLPNHVQTDLFRAVHGMIVGAIRAAHIDRSRDRYVYVSGFSGKGWLRVVVRDNGVPVASAAPAASQERSLRRQRDLLMVENFARQKGWTIDSFSNADETQTALSINGLHSMGSPFGSDSSETTLHGLGGGAAGALPFAGTGMLSGAMQLFSMPTIAAPHALCCP